MRIAILTGGNDFKAVVDTRVRTAKSFLIHDMDSNEYVIRSTVNTVTLSDIFLYSHKNSRPGTLPYGAGYPVALFQMMKK